MSRPTVVHLVPHTHWDREWYLPFQSFRLRLVDLIDDLLDEMVADERVRFTLDGQTATVLDYLEVRPERGGQLATLVREGRLSIGPWHILMDEFLVSGETIVRNLQLGVRVAEGLGRAMRVGYLPDMFGHIAQMPQILRRAGMRDAVVWRGVPAAIGEHAFTWLAPDGSNVRCEYLLGGYGNARDLLDQPDAIGPKLEAYLARFGGAFGEDEVLAMYGEDHSVPVPGYAAAAAAFNASQDRHTLLVETLDAYLEAMARVGTPPRAGWTGELRSGARANVLMGVTSHHVDVRTAAARAERTLERLTEPILALHARDWPGLELDAAWRRVIENSAHDSICACSADEVVAQVLVRFAEATQIGRGLLDGALRRAAAGLPGGAWLVADPSPTARRALVELTVDERGDPDPTALVEARLPDGGLVPVQELGRECTILEEVELAGGELPDYLRLRLHGREIYRAWLVDWSLSGEEPPLLVLRGLPDDRGQHFDPDGMLAELERRAAPRPEARWRLRVERLPRRTFLAQVPVPPLGWTGVWPALAAKAGRGAAPVPRHRVQAGDGWLDNGLVRVQLLSDGTLRLEGSGTVLTGVGRLVDGGDVGDAYNYGPPPRDRLVEAPGDVQAAAGESGPLRATLSVTRAFGWPAGLVADLSGRAAETRRVVVEMSVALHAEEPFVRLRLRWVNPCTDHRLRFHVPLPAPVAGSWAEGQFAVVARGLTAEGGHGEVPLPTFPAHGFVAVDGVAVLLDAVTEYEVVDGRELALTLLRATGRISRDAHPWRADPAGPDLPTPAAQLLGPLEATFALMPWRGEPGPEVVGALERYRLPLLAVPATGPASVLMGQAEGLRIEGAGVVMTALRRTADGLELRLANETAQAAAVAVTGPFEAALETNLLGVTGPELPVKGGRVELTVGAWEIRTVQLRAGVPRRG